MKVIYGASDLLTKAYVTPLMNFVMICKNNNLVKQNSTNI